jgi:nucleoside-diphosphate-sugar epimerase
MSAFLFAGGSGFIGSNIVEELRRREETIRVIDDFSTGRRDCGQADAIVCPHNLMEPR